MKKAEIKKDIKKAHTLHTDFYTDPDLFLLIKEKIFANSWLYACDATVLKNSFDVYPLNFYPEFLEEPILFSKDENDVEHCLSNVCTHRGNILIDNPSNRRVLSCGYHGRCFRHNGHFKSMPCFEKAEDFPSEADHLFQIPFGKWLNMFFVGLEAKGDFIDLIQPMVERLNFLPLEELVFHPDKSVDYPLKANWMLYCENYLEGFHIPFVHPGLNEALAFEEYDYELYEHCNLQLGIAKEGELCFDIPSGHPDHGKNVFAYYYFLYPNMMLNFYPWGLSTNIICPKGVEETLISFRTYLFPGKESLYQNNGLHQTEMEDEAIVLQVQKGIKSRFYQRGRFSPSMEKAVHWFHQKMATSLS